MLISNDEGTYACMGQREPTTAAGEHIRMKRHRLTEEEVKLLATESTTSAHGGGRSGMQGKSESIEMNRDNGYDLRTPFITSYSDISTTRREQSHR